MPIINVLPDLLVNKIAAGEVIERPASVAKELIENSCDAGANRIEIAIEQGGRKLIRIVDDGEGMDAEDLTRSILPHATSKIRNEQDLYAIATMGFRGEALPSIGAVSQLRIVSRRVDANEAHEICMAGARLEPVMLAGGPAGTTVEVRELFFNVPARQKFLRTPQTEMGHITEQVARIALTHTDIEFKLTHNGRLIYHLRPTDSMRPRIADLYGAEVAQHLIDFSRNERGLDIQGFAGAPADSRSSAKWQYIFLNGRYIRDRFVTHAAREAYRGLIEANRFPIFFIALKVSPQDVDVNVHPTKSEVRWRNSNLVYSQVLSALRDRFLNANLTPGYRTDKVCTDQDRPCCQSTSSAGDVTSTDSETDADLEADRRRQVRQSIADFYKRISPPVGSSPPSPGQSPMGPTSARPSAGPGLPAIPTPADMPASSFEPASSATAENALPVSPLRREGYHNVMQVHREFLVWETDDGLAIIDQHALHERILYEQISEQITRGPLESQRLLIPDTIDVTADHIALIETQGDLLARIGFELTPFGPNTIAVHAVPSLMKPERINEFLRDVLDRLADRGAPASPELLLNDLISMYACKAAVKAGDVLSAEEIDALMSQRELAGRVSNCPHGRPTSLNLTLQDIERQFKRT